MDKFSDMPFSQAVPFTEVANVLQGTPPNLDPGYPCIQAMMKSTTVAMHYSTNSPLKRGHPSIQDTLVAPKDDRIRGRSLSCHRRVHLQSVISFIRGSIVVILLGSHCIPEQQITLHT